MFTLANILWAVVIGAVAGWILGDGGQGFFFNLIAGFLGSILGSYLQGWFSFIPNGWVLPWSSLALIPTLIGALIFIIIVNWATKTRHHKNSR
jgi:uncharacterized membrane protein YeaQ/YmgE (transglycosylase-associated protein family)